MPASRHEFEGVAGRARDEIGRELDLIDESRFAFAWIVDFPMYEKDDETGSVDFSHNPFSMPQGGRAALDGDPLDVLGYQYDPPPPPPFALQRLRDRFGRDPEPQARDHVQGVRTGGLLARMRCANDSAHGQRLPLRRAAPWRLCGGASTGSSWLLADTANIREVILFPMNQRAEDLMMNAPSEPTAEQLMELGLRVIPQD